MTNQKLVAGGYLDFLTKSELDESMGHHFDNAIVKWYRGIDYLTFVGSGNGTSSISIPYAPESGYAWSLKLIGVYAGGLSALNFAVYLSENIGTAPIGFGVGNASVPGVATVTWSSEQIVIKDGRVITLAASATILNYILAVKQVPIEMQGKL